jgi:integral membrane protein (TIGR01906 family)
MKKKVINIFVPIVLMLFIISFSVVFSLNLRQLYYFDIDYLNIPQQSGYSEEMLKENYDILIDYNNIGAKETLEFNGIPMSESGRSHFVEVRNIFVGIEILLIITFFLSLAGILYKLRKKEYAFLKHTSIITVALPAILGILVSINWESVFIGFHKIVFRNNDWIFDAATDPIILALPDEFFMHCAVLIVATAIFLSLISLILYRVLTRKQR